jgi:predicted  nucleic acid-binding Zn-ribbon protein
VLLLIIAKIGDPSATSDLESNLIESIEQKQKALFNVRGEARELDERLKSRQEQLSELNQRIARLKEQLASVSKQAAELAQSQSEEKQNLQLVLQVLTEEMERLLGPNFTNIFKKKVDDWSSKEKQHLKKSLSTC